LIDSLKDFPPSSDLRQCFKDALQLLDLRRVTLAGEAQSLLHLAHNFSRWDCRDPRDRVNSLVGVAFKSDPSPWFSPSYRSDARGLYQHFAKTYICATKDLSILHFAGHSGRFLPSITDGVLYICSVHITHDKETAAATWCPDWENEMRPLLLHPKKLHEWSHWFCRDSVCTPL
jgi:hypothetical protein